MSLYVAEERERQLVPSLVSSSSPSFDYIFPSSTNPATRHTLVLPSSLSPFFSYSLSLIITTTLLFILSHSSSSLPSSPSPSFSYYFFCHLLLHILLNCHIYSDCRGCLSFCRNRVKYFMTVSSFAVSFTILITSATDKVMPPGPAGRLRVVLLGTDRRHSLNAMYVQ